MRHEYHCQPPGSEVFLTCWYKQEGHWAPRHRYTGDGPHRECHPRLLPVTMSQAKQRKRFLTTHQPSPQVYASVCPKLGVKLQVVVISSSIRSYPYIYSHSCNFVIHLPSGDITLLFALIQTFKFFVVYSLQPAMPRYHRYHQLSKGIIVLVFAIFFHQSSTSICRSAKLIIVYSLPRQIEYTTLEEFFNSNH